MHPRGSLYCAYNLEYDAAAILAFLGHASLESIAFLGWRKHGNWSIRYIRGKELIIRNRLTKASHRFYDTFPFYQVSLDRASAKIFGASSKIAIPKEWYLDFANVLRGPDRLRALEYCAEDARTCHRLQAHVARSFLATGFIFSRPLSPGYIASQKLKGRVPRTSNELFGRSYYGGRVEIWKRGRLGPVSVYDIRSAYPAALRSCRIPLPSRPVTAYSPLAAYGSYLCRVRASFPALPWRSGDSEMLYYPIGEWHEWYSRPHVELARECGIRLDILAGYECDASDILVPEIEEMYTLRKSKPEYDIAYKLVLNSLYGKLAARIPRYIDADGAIRRVERVEGRLLERIDTYGSTTCLAVAAHVTATTQAALVRAARHAPDRVVALMTDGLVVQGHEPLPLDLSPSLGAWDCEQWDDSVFVGAGIYALHSHEINPKTGAPWGWKSKYRGFSARTSLPELLAAETKDTWISVPALRGRSLMQAARAHDFSSLNSLEEIRQRKNVNADSKRAWKSEFSRASDTLVKSSESYPLTVIECAEESIARLSAQGRLPRNMRELIK